MTSLRSALGTFFNRVFPAPRWLVNYARRDADREIAELEAELVAERARPDVRDRHIIEIEDGLAELRKIRADLN